MCAAKPAWSAPLEKRRLVIVLVLVLAVSAIKVSEDVLGGESGPIDEAILLFIRGHVPSRLTGFLEAITFAGSLRVVSARDWCDDCTAVREAPLRGSAYRNFDDRRCDCGLRHQDGGGPSSPGAVRNRVVLGVQFSQWTYSLRRGIRHCCRSLHQQDLARSARVRAVDSDFMDLSHRLFASCARRALAN